MPLITIYEFSMSMQAFFYHTTGGAGNSCPTARVSLVRTFGLLYIDRTRSLILFRRTHPFHEENPTVMKNRRADTPDTRRRRIIGCAASLGLSATLFPGALAAFAEGSGEITIDIIAAAERIAGLSFTDEERRSLLKRLNELGKRYEAMRSFPLDNAFPLALVFAPVIIPAPRAPRKPLALKPPKVSWSGNIEDLAFLPLTHLARLIELRKVSSASLTRMYLNRLKKYDPVLHCMVTPTEELALAQASRADEEIAAGKRRGPLHGIPWGAKDLLAVRGYPTTWGSEFYTTRTLDYDAAVVSRLHNAGAVLIAKLSMGRFAGGENWFGGMTRNPWNPQEGSSGSSAGPGAATAAGLVGFSVGTETRGSIAGPCERCGVSGLRPTYGRVSRHGAMALSWSLDKIGPICRTAEDCAVVFNEIYGPDGRDASLIDAPFVWDDGLDVRTLRVGYVEEEFAGNMESVGDRARLNNRLNRAALDKLRSLGIRLVPFTLPKIPEGIVEFILSVEAAAAFDYLNAGMTELREAKALTNYRADRFVPAVEYLQANRIRTRIMREMEEAMSGIDAYVTPTFVGPTNWLTNLTGHPELIVPCGFVKENSPMSISFVGKPFGEATVLALARAYQSVTDFHTRHPKL
jgi:Asp-tRNA(Asn)/Glu-tRNA(Gln) amidotransferase A subunit family amidase